MHAPSQLSSTGTATTRITPPKTAAHEIRWWVCVRLPRAVVVVSKTPARRSGGASYMFTLLDIGFSFHPGCRAPRAYCIATDQVFGRAVVGGIGGAPVGRFVESSRSISTS